MSAASGDTVPPRAWLVWLVGVSVYFLAVFNRSSLGVAGLLANERFHIGASQLSVFTFLQLLVYAGMQVPAGLLVDRFGARTMLLTGATVMTVAQAGFALTSSYPAALVARGVVGVGDALVWVSVLRLVGAWFPRRRVPVITQFSSMAGFLGSIAAAVPLSWALGRFGWTEAYLVAAVAGPVIVLLLLVVLADAPDRRHVTGETLSLAALRQNLAAAWRQPGTRLAFWVHWATPFSSSTMSLLWGFPFLVRGEGYTHAQAAVLLTVLTVSGAVFGPMLGYFAGRHPWHRSSAGLGIVGVTAALWTLVLAWPGHAPTVVIVALMIVVGFGGPGSIMAFDIGRTSNSAERFASATGIINQAGFVATIVLVLAVGWLLEWRTPGHGADYTLGAFRWAMSFQYLLWTLGVVQILRYRRRVRSLLDRTQVESGSTMVALP